VSRKLLTELTTVLAIGLALGLAFGLALGLTLGLASYTDRHSVRPTDTAVDVYFYDELKSNCYISSLTC